MTHYFWYGLYKINQVCFWYKTRLFCFYHIPSCMDKSIPHPVQYGQVYTTSRPVWTNLLITYQVRPGPAVKGQSHFMPLTIHFEVAAVSFHSHLRGKNFLPSLGYFKYAPRICDFVKKPQAVFKSWIKNKSTIYEYRSNQAFIICSYNV